MHLIAHDKMTGAGRAAIDAYLALPVGTKPSCPYFNNRRRRSRSALRVLKGKGSPAEIAEEALIEAKLARMDLATLSTDKFKEFLVSRDLGVDCSGFAYHVLDAYAKETVGKPIRSVVKPIRRGLVGSILARLRPAENTGVASFAHESNSAAIPASEARVGDVITFMGTGKDKTYNHILVVTGVDLVPAADGASEGLRISYAHSYAWPSDGTLNHGVREGDILVTGNDLLGGVWKEQGVIGPDNHTFASARDARETSVRRLNAFAV